jgi:hypothetical protein
VIDALHRLLTREASTRSSALLRIGLVLLLWVRYAADMSPWQILLPGRMLLGASFFASTTLLLVGWRSRLTAAWAGVTMVVATYAFGMYGEMELWTHHHTWILCAGTALLCLTPCGGSFSWDRMQAVRRARERGEAPPPERGPVWGLTLIALQVSAVYAWSAYDKCTWSFLSGAELERILVYVYTGFRPEQAWVVPLLAVAAWITVIVEWVLPFGLFVRRWQWVLVPVGIALHAMFYVLLPVGTFSLTMLWLYLAYLDPDDVHRFTERVLE